MYFITSEIEVFHIFDDHLFSLLGELPVSLLCLLLYWVICPLKNLICGTSLVAQWLRIHLPLQRTQVRALVWEDPTCPLAAEQLSLRAATTEARAPLQ